MKTQVILSAAELADLIGAVMAYNGRQAQAIHVFDGEGRPLAVGHIAIECEAPGLSVRVAPDGAEASEAQGIASLLYREHLDRVDVKATVKP